MTAKMSWEILPMAETGLRSVVPRARTLRGRRVSVWKEEDRERDEPEDGEDACQHKGHDCRPPLNALLTEYDGNEDDAKQTADRHSDENDLRRRFVLGLRGRLLPPRSPLLLSLILILVVFARLSAHKQRTSPRPLRRPREVWPQNVSPNQRDAEDRFGGHDREGRPEDPAASAIGAGGDGTGSPARVMGEGGEEEPAGDHAL